MLLHKTQRSGALARVGSIFFTLLVAGAMPAFAQTLTPHDSGSINRATRNDWFTGAPVFDNLIHDPDNISMDLANFDDPPCKSPTSCALTTRYTSNSYVFFDVPDTLDNVSKVELNFQLTILSSLAPWDTGDFSWQAWSIVSPPTAFEEAYSGTATVAGLALLSDLGSGVQYGSGSTGGGAVAFTFEGAALADFLAARGGVLGIGFSSPSNYMGSVSASLSDMQLVVNLVPEPENYLLMLAGLSAIVSVVRRSRAAAA